MRPIPNQSLQHSSTQRGFTFIELLMAMFIFAIGLLGLAALQVVSLNQSSGGRSRGHAAFVAHSVLDRIVAEGQVTASERIINETGIASTTTGWDFLGAADGTANSGTLAYDVGGKAISDGDTTTPVNFTVSWFSNTGNLNPGTHSGLQEFVVNVVWLESPPKGSSTPTTKALSVSRYVRI